MCADKAALILVAPLFPTMVPTDAITDKWTQFCALQKSQNTISTINLKEAQGNYHDVGGIRIVQEPLTTGVLHLKWNSFSFSKFYMKVSSP